MQIRTIQQQLERIKSNKYKIYANVAWKWNIEYFLHTIYKYLFSFFLARRKWMSWMRINTILFHNLIHLRRLEQKRIVLKISFFFGLYIKYSNIIFCSFLHSHILPSSLILCFIIFHINLKFFTHSLSSLIFNNFILFNFVYEENFLFNGIVKNFSLWTCLI